LDGQAFNGEDLFICEEIQRGLTTNLHEDFLLGGLERNVKQFHETVEAALSGSEVNLGIGATVVKRCDGTPSCSHEGRLSPAEPGRFETIVWPTNSVSATCN
jgi:hypothetical protein